MRNFEDREVVYEGIEMITVLYLGTAYLSLFTFTMPHRQNLFGARIDQIMQRHSNP